MQQKSIRIIILTNTLLPGGAEKQSILLFNSLSKYFDTKLVVYYGNQVYNVYSSMIHNQQNVIFLNGNHLTKIKKLNQLFREHKETICFSYLATTNLLNGLIGKYAGVRYRIGGIRNSKLQPMKQLIQKHLHNHWLHATIFNNYTGMNAMIRAGFNPSKCFQIDNCIEVQNEPVNIMQKPMIRILTIGRFVKQKDFISALKVIHELRKTVSKIRLTIAGHGPDEQNLKKTILNFMLDEYVEIITNPANVKELYKQSDIFLSTSKFEGMSNAIMEAMSYGLPVIATDSGDTSRLVIHGQTGYVTKIGNISEMVKVINQLINNPKQAKQMGLAGYNHMKQNFSIEQFTNKYLDFIHTFVK